MSEAPRDHREFETEGSFFNYYPVFRPLRPVWNALKRAGFKRGGLDRGSRVLPR
jgi:hypothetical protein